MSERLDRAGAHLTAATDQEVLNVLRTTGYYLAQFGLEDDTRYAFPVGPLAWVGGHAPSEPTDPFFAVVTKAPPPEVTVTVVMADRTLNDMKRVGEWPTVPDSPTLTILRED